MLKKGTIEELKSYVSNGDGFSYTNLFYVMFPSDVHVSDDNVYKHGLFCTNVTVPTKQMMTISREIGMSQQYITHGFVNAPVSMTFRILNDQSTRNYFDSWQKRIINAYPDDNEALEGRFEVNYPVDYTRQIKIFQLKRGVSYPVFDKFADKKLGPINLVFDLDIDIGTKMETTYVWKLHKAYPINITSDAFSDGPTTISTITVEFTYERFTGESASENETNKNAKKLAKAIGTISSIFN